MAQNYTRQSSFADGDTITAALFNNEFNQVVNAFAYSASSDSSTGHKHDGTSGQGGNIPQIGDIDFLNKIVVDNTNNRWGFYVQVSGGTVEQLRIQDGAIVPVTNNDIDLGTSSLEFKDLFLDGTAHIDTLDVDVNATVAGTLGVTGATTLSSTLGVTGAITGSSTLQATTITATTAFVPDASDGASLGTVSLEFSDLFLADGALIAFGNDQDVTITHLADAGLLLNGARGLFFNDTTQYINAPNGTTLDIAATDEIELNATLIDINGAADVSGNLAVGGNLTVTGNATIAGNLTFGDAATDTVAFSADVASNLLPSVDNTYDLGASGSEWKDLYIDGTANIDSLVADTADINGGTIDGATIATSDITVGSGKTLNVSAGTLTLADDQISGDKVEGGTIAATTITTLTSTTVDTTNLEVTTLKAKDGTAAGSIADSTGVVTLASSVLTTTDINGGTIDSAVIGGTTPAAITGTAITATGIMTATGTSVFASLDISGDIDVDGTTNLDVVDIDGAVDFASTTAHAGNATFADNAKAIFGAGSDLQIYHDGTHSYVSDQGTGNIKILADDFIVKNSADTETMIQAFTDAAVSLWYDNSTKLATTATGIDVTGSVTADGLTVDGTATFNTGSGTADNVVITSTDSGGSTAPDLVLFRDSVSPVDGDNVGMVQFRGNDDASAERNYAAIYASINDATSTSVDGKLSFAVTTANTTAPSSGTTFMTIDGGGDISFYEDTGTTAKLTWSASNESLTFGTNLAITTNEIDVATGDLTLDVAGDINLDSDNGYIYLKDDGTSIGLFKLTSSDFYIKSVVSDRDIIFQGNDGGSAITALTLDMSAAGAATFNSSVTSTGLISSSLLNSANNSLTILGGGSATNNGANLTLYGGSAEASAGDFRFRNGTTETARITAAGAATFNGTVETGGTLYIPQWIEHSGDSNTYFGFPSGDEFKVVTANVGRLHIKGSESVWNEGGANADFRVESVNNANMLFVDASTNRVGIGEASPDTPLHLTTSSSGTAVTIESTDGSSAAGSTVILYKNSASPLAGDGLSTIKFRGNDSGGATNDYVQLVATLEDPTATAEDGRFTIQALTNGANKNRLSVNSTELNINESGQDLNFRVESDSNDHMLFVDGGANRIGVGTSGPLEILHGHNGSGDDGTYLRLSGGGSLNESYGGWMRGYGVSGNGGFLELGVVDAGTKKTAMQVTAQGNNLKFYTAAVERLQFDYLGNTVFNESGVNSDFRVESDGNANMLFVDGGANRVGIGTTDVSSQGTLAVNGSAILGRTSTTTGDLFSSGGGNSGAYNGIAILSNSDEINAQSNTSLSSWIVDVGGRAGDGLTFPVNTADSFGVRRVAAGGTYYGAANYFQISGGSTVINEDSNDHDFRVESNGNANMLFVDGGSDHVIVGGSVNYENATFQVQGAKNLIVGIPQEGIAVTDTTAVAAGVGGAITFNGQYNSAGQYTNFASIEGEKRIATSGHYDGALVLKARTNGTNTHERARFDDVEAVINGEGRNTDFRVESDNNTHALFVDAGNSRVGINDSAPTGNLSINGLNITYLSRAYTMSTSAVEVLRLYGFGNTPCFIRVYRQDITSPQGSQLIELYVASYGSGSNSTLANLVQEDKVIQGSIHGVTFTEAIVTNGINISVTGDDAGGEAQTLYFEVHHIAGTVSVL